MAQQAGASKKVSATLEEALNLLGNNYEGELSEDSDHTLVRTGTDQTRRR